MGEWVLAATVVVVCGIALGVGYWNWGRPKKVNKPLPKGPDATEYLSELEKLRAMGSNGKYKKTGS